MQVLQLLKYIQDNNNNDDAWSEAEIKALVQFVHFRCDNSNWPTHHKKEY